MFLFSGNILDHIGNTPSKKAWGNFFSLIEVHRHELLGLEVSAALHCNAPLINWILRLQIEDFPTNRETSELDLLCALEDEFGTVKDVKCFVWTSGHFLFLCQLRFDCVPFLGHISAIDRKL